MKDAGVFQDEIRLLLDCSKRLQGKLADDSIPVVEEVSRECIEEINYLVGEMMFAQDKESFYGDAEDYYDNAGG